MAKTQGTERQGVVIGVGDKVGVEFAEGPYTGVVAVITGTKCTINFDDGTSEVCDLKDVKLISKAQVDDSDAETTPPPVSPDAQQLEKRATAKRKGAVDATNRANTAESAALDSKNAGKPLTEEEKIFMEKVAGRLNGKKSRSGDIMVTQARMSSLPSSSDMTRYARLKRQIGE